MKMKLSVVLVGLLVFGAMAHSPALADDAEVEAAYLESMQGVTRDPGELAQFGDGAAWLGVESIAGGTSYRVNIDAPNIVGVRLEQPGTGTAYVSISATDGARMSQQVDAAAKVEVDAQALRGGYTVRVPGTTPNNLSLVLETPDGGEALWVVTSQDGLSGKELGLIFDSNQAAPCRTHTLKCSGGCMTSKECCTIIVCFDCIDCQITCGKCQEPIP